MWFTSLQRVFGRRATGATSRPSVARRRSFRLSVEQLEDRTCPSNFSAATVSELIADINAANLAGGANTITLQAGTDFTLTAVDNSWDGATGLPAITPGDSLTILGNGDTISRSTDSTTPAFRLLDVYGGASLTLKNLRLTNGLADGSGGFAAQGGAIYNRGNLVLDGVNVAYNRAFGGLYGGAWGGGIFSSGNLTLEGGSTVQNNVAAGGPGSRAQGPTKLSPGHGGGPGGYAYGGGIYVADGTAILTGATVSGNTAQGGNGGPGLSSYWRGGVGGNAYGGGIYVAAGTVAVTSTTLSGNAAQGGSSGSPYPTYSGGGFGGGLYAAGGTVTLRYDTVSQNSATYGGGIYIDPSAIVYLDAYTQKHVKGNHASIDPSIDGFWTPV